MGKMVPSKGKKGGKKPEWLEKLRGGDPTQIVKFLIEVGREGKFKREGKKENEMTKIKQEGVQLGVTNVEKGQKKCKGASGKSQQKTMPFGAGGGLECLGVWGGGQRLGGMCK